MNGSNRPMRVIPSATSDAAIGDPTPPLPTTSALLPVTSKPLRFTPRAKPAPSNWSPSSDPSSRTSTALEAPATCAMGVSSSTSSVVTTLCGMVTSAPRMLDILNSSGKNSR